MHSVFTAEPGLRPRRPGGYDGGPSFHGSGWPSRRHTTRQRREGLDTRDALPGPLRWHGL